MATGPPGQSYPGQRYIFIGFSIFINYARDKPHKSIFNPSGVRRFSLSYPPPPPIDLKLQNLRVFLKK